MRISGFVRLNRMFLALCAILLALPATAAANTVTQNVSWTINRPETSVRYRVVAYGDSIFAGYRGSLSSVARRAAPHVAGEYASNLWGTDVEVIRRAKSGAIASDIYNNKIVAERSYMQATSTRVVMFEMCGNDGLQARSSFAGQTGTCNYGPLNTALTNCTTYTERAMQAINTYAPTAKVKIISNLYYPGYAADNALASCTDAATGQRPNKQSAFLPYIARINWRQCNLAERYGFRCDDAFAEWMGADYDSNGDGLVDSQALRYRSGEAEADYVTRITTTLRGTIRDANAHLVSSSTSADYLQSDNTHGTYYGSTVGVGFFGGTGSGSAAPEFSGSQNSIWNRYGHERTGWSMSLFNPPAP